jgi:hypothetical protein
MNRCECFDFPVSWSFYRAHCWEVHGFDPGNNEPPQHTVEELHERLAALEEAQSEKPQADWPRRERSNPKLSGGVRL